MTTINNLTIEQMREIVSGAPEGSTMYGDNLGDPLYYMFKEKHWWFFSRSLGDWATSSINYGEAEILGTLLDLKDIRTAIAEHDSKIKCWSCDKYMTKSQRSANDGFCIHCSNEVDLGCNHNFEDVTIYGDSHKTYQCTICEFRDEEAERHG